MAHCYLTDQIPTADHIKKVDDWMELHMNLDKNDYNGSKTTTSQIKKLAVEYGKMKKTKEYIYFNLKKIKKELEKNTPVIVSVYYPAPSNSEKYIAHSLLVIGMDNKFIYVNDPGRTKGKKYKFKHEDFLKYWKTFFYSALILKR